ncbi:helix-turn-helix transcriptional regulator [Syntrophomonas palmitatica]|uniref:helix-turn-helix transcriptional regulator n=1 Tax=Syntrophomonas palmitatica TaxID=402877 RepID=UPI0006CF2EBD|nr:WYL domain-containing protein [Syntrophomonas palmitatica]
MIKRNRTASMAESAIRLRNFIVDNPDLEQDELMQALKIGSQANLYSLLLGLSNDEEICVNGEFLVLNAGQRLTTGDIDDYLNDNPQSEKAAPRLAERLLYLYWCLHKAIPDGGLTFEAIMNIYIELFMDSTGQVPKAGALKRMIYRDMEEFERLKIWIDRSDTTKKYCLRDEYLPKLSAESAAAVYVSMLLYRDTLMDQATLCAKEQLEKAFFKRFPERSKLLKERIYVLGDTLANPKEFGDNLGKLIRAVGESFRIKISYINNEGEKSDRLLEPLGLVCKRNVWYLIAREVEKNEPRTFRVDQIMHLSVRDSEAFAYPPGFSLAEYIGCSWGVFNNDQIETVRLKFSPKVAFRVKNLHYHPSQKIAQECTDGSVILEFEVCGLLEMQNWIMQWGTEVEVLEPLSLREEILQTARNIINKYRAKNKRKTRRSY